MKSNVAILLLSSFLVFLFAYTGISKLADPERFRATLLQVPFISFGAGALALVVPMAEVVIALLLLFPATRFMGLWASAVLLSLFTVYLLLMLLFVPHLPCSCGGVIGRLSWQGHLGMNVGLIGVTVLGIRRMRRGKKMTDER